MNFTMQKNPLGRQFSRSIISARNPSFQQEPWGILMHTLPHTLENNASGYPQQGRQAELRLKRQKGAKCE